MIGLLGGAYYLGKNSGQAIPDNIISTPTPEVIQGFNPSITVIKPSWVMFNANQQSWRAYDNVTNGLSLTFPSEFELDENRGGGAFRILFAGPTQKDQTELYDGIGLTFSSGVMNNKALKEIVNLAVADKIKNPVNPGNPIIEYPREITYGNLNGYQYKTQELGEYTIIYLTDGSQKYIRIIKITDDPTNKGFEKMVDKILATLKFS